MAVPRERWGLADRGAGGSAALLFPKPRGRAREDDRQVVSGVIHVQRNGLMWKDAPATYGRPKTLYNRWKR